MHRSIQLDITTTQESHIKNSGHHALNKESVIKLEIAKKIVVLFLNFWKDISGSCIENKS